MEWPGLPEREPTPADLSDRERVGLAGYGRLSDRKPGSMEDLRSGRRNAPWAVGTASGDTAWPVGADSAAKLRRRSGEPCQPG